MRGSELILGSTVGSVEELTRNLVLDVEVKNENS